MKLSRTISAPSSADSAGERIAAYLEAAGFKLVGTEPCPVYRRGSLAGSMFSFSPKTYRATALVETIAGADSPTTVFANLEVNTTGQIVTKSMRRSWEQELAGVSLSAWVSCRWST